MREAFLDAFSHIQREGAADLLKWLEQSDFFTAPASTRFHGCHSGGLLEHSMNVYRRLNQLCNTEEFAGRYSDETIAITALCHDLCKVNFYKPSFRNVKDESGRWVRKDTWEIEEKFPCGEHSDKSIIILQNFIKLTPDEIMAIRAHMGGFDTSVKGGSFMIGNIFERSHLAVLLHTADLHATYFDEGKG
jgi:hypothetical protein